MDDVVKVNIFLKNIADIDSVDERRGRLTGISKVNNGTGHLQYSLGRRDSNTPLDVTRDVNLAVRTNEFSCLGRRADMKVSGLLPCRAVILPASVDSSG